MEEKDIWKKSATLKGELPTQAPNLTLLNTLDVFVFISTVPKYCF